MKQEMYLSENVLSHLETDGFLPEDDDNLSDVNPLAANPGKFLLCEIRISSIYFLLSVYV